MRQPDKKQIDRGPRVAPEKLDIPAGLGHAQTIGILRGMAMKFPINQKGNNSAFQSMEVFCTLLEKEIFEYCASFEITKRLTGESYFQRSNLHLRRTLEKMPDAVSRSRTSKKVSRPSPAELDRLKIESGDKIAKNEYTNMMIRSCERLYAPLETEQQYFRTIMVEAMLWRDIGKKLKYSGQDYLIYTGNIAWWAGQILGAARMQKEMKEEEGDTKSKIPKRSAAEFRNIVMEEADKLLIKSSVFGKKSELRDIYLRNVRSRFPEMKEGYDRGNAHILAELKLGLKKRKKH